VYITIEVANRDLSCLDDCVISIPPELGEEIEILDAYIYYCEHSDLYNNILKIRDLGHNRVQLTWTAVTTDVSYYDGSVTDTVVEINGEFILVKSNSITDLNLITAVQQKRNISTVNIENSFEDITNIEISKFEEKYNLKLPLEYKEFLLKSNGGKPCPRKFTSTDHKIISRVMMFFPLTNAIPYNLAFYYETYGIGKMIPENLLPIGEDPIKNLVCLSLDKKSFGAILYWNKDDEEYRRSKKAKPSYKCFNHISNNFTNFLNSLSE
jgi:hypothetical protein